MSADDEAKWLEIKSRYESGDKAREIADDLNVSYRTIYRRAKKEGWSKKSGSVSVKKKSESTKAEAHDEPEALEASVPDPTPAPVPAVAVTDIVEKETTYEQPDSTSEPEPADSNKDVDGQDESDIVQSIENTNARKQVDDQTSQALRLISNFRAMGGSICIKDNRIALNNNDMQPEVANQLRSEMSKLKRSVGLCLLKEVQTNGEQSEKKP